MGTVLGRESLARDRHAQMKVLRVRWFDSYDVVLDRAGASSLCLVDPVSGAWGGASLQCNSVPRHGLAIHEMIERVVARRRLRMF